jgi:hypothetical protein
MANPIDYFAIQAMLAKYCFALDTKDWNLLNDVFTQDAHASFPFAKDMVGVGTISSAIEKRSGCRTPQR